MANEPTMMVRSDSGFESLGDTDITPRRQAIQNILDEVDDTETLDDFSQTFRKLFQIKAVTWDHIIYSLEILTLQVIKTTKNVSERLRIFSAGWLHAVQFSARKEVQALGKNFNSAHQYSLTNVHSNLLRWILFYADPERFEDHVDMIGAFSMHMITQTPGPPIINTYQLPGEAVVRRHGILPTTIGRRPVDFQVIQKFSSTKQSLREILDTCKPAFSTFLAVSIVDSGIATPCIYIGANTDTCPSSLIALVRKRNAEMRPMDRCGLIFVRDPPVLLGLAASEKYRALPREKRFGISRTMQSPIGHRLTSGTSNARGTSLSLGKRDLGTLCLWLTDGNSRTFGLTCGHVLSPAEHDVADVFIPAFAEYEVISLLQQYFVPVPEHCQERLQSWDSCKAGNLISSQQQVSSGFLIDWAIFETLAPRRNVAKFDVNLYKQVDLDSTIVPVTLGRRAVKVGAITGATSGIVGWQPCDMFFDEIAEPFASYLLLGDEETEKIAELGDSGSLVSHYIDDDSDSLAHPTGLLFAKSSTNLHWAFFNPLADVLESIKGATGLELRLALP